ncbi:LysR family transcriptional regulator, regulator for metE and metH [Dyadobacter soli]|uniref:LysR family transcriptional regulator, regulator for metE and metH n=1 Tax=Dyadobacter soli TaxID=659014 RepID=A0A1G7L1Q1_9BACT|nr:LysR family transcriptional regulator [Dyadobacter soli]SDF43291.1 LysR family transcriptional regulator, regulator for metE and metH [Dyadobacter soli]
MNNTHDMLTLQHLYIIEKITSEGSVTKAAEKLNLTQSALSHQIRDLEAASGVKLFNRIGKKLVLNEAGQRVVNSSQQVLPVIRELENELKAMREGKKQTIRISTECYTCYHWLPRLLSDFNAHFPGTEIQIVAEATRRPMEYLEAGKLELALVNGTNNNSSLHFEPLFEDRMVALVSDKHPLALRNTPLEFSDMHPETLIAFQTSANSNLLSPDLVSHLSPKKITHIPMTGAIVEMVRFGLGITIMAEWAARQYLSTGGLTTLPFRSEVGTRHWYTCTHKDRSEALSGLVSRIQSALLGVENPVMA